MRVLLLGEFSGVYKNLSEGLRELGIDVTLASNGDVWKKIGGADVELYPLQRNLFGKIYYYLFFPLVDNRFQNYDIVQAITPMIYSWQINELAMNRIRSNNNKLFINAAGADCFQYKAYLAGKYRYSLFDNNPAIAKVFGSKSVKGKFLNHATQKLYKHADGIIPVVPFEYEIPYEKMKNRRKAILFPIDYTEIKYESNKISKKIVFFHGISRPADKGSPYIIKAMKIIEQRYPRDVKCITVEKLPYNEYVNVLSQANIILDQCKSYGYGMNATISLAKGKIVMSGAEPEVLEAGGLYDCPIYNITPNVNQIVEQMEKIIANKKQIHEIGQRGREYVMKHHDYIKIAQEYVEEWKK